MQKYKCVFCGKIFDELDFKEQLSEWGVFSIENIVGTLILQEKWIAQCECGNESFSITF